VKLSQPAAKRVRRDSYAQWWAIILVILGTAGISSAWIRLGTFWNGYILDMTGPAWNYILFRRLFTVKTENAWSLLITTGQIPAQPRWMFCDTFMRLGKVSVRKGGFWDGLLL
jgi:hypothetical protein